MHEFNDMPMHSSNISLLILPIFYQRSFLQLAVSTQNMCIGTILLYLDSVSFNIHYLYCYSFDPHILK